MRIPCTGTDEPQTVCLLACLLLTVVSLPFSFFSSAPSILFPSALWPLLLYLVVVRMDALFCGPRAKAFRVRQAAAARRGEAHKLAKLRSRWVALAAVPRTSSLAHDNGARDSSVDVRTGASRQERGQLQAASSLLPSASSASQ